MPLPSKRQDRHMQKVKDKAERAGKAQGRNGKIIESELKSEAQIRKERKAKRNVALKNMPKDKRARVVKKLNEEYKQRKDFQQKTQAAAATLQRASGAGGKNKGRAGRGGGGGGKRN